MAHDARYWLDRLKALPLPDRVRIMNVCGGHERSITSAGLRTAIPSRIELIPGPGCPVCICPEEDVYEAMQLALNEDVILVAFGDMLRVPVNVPKREPRSLEQAKAAGADIRPIASPTEVAAVARDNPDRQVVFFAAGFETTTAPVAAMLAEGAPDNLSVLLSGRLTWPAVAMLLESGEPGFDALIAPGHVSTVVRPGGNAVARECLDRVMQVQDATWRGIGVIPKSGYGLRPAYEHCDARLQFPSYADDSRKRVGQMPPGCDCAKVVLGKIYPNECRLFGAACTPRKPIGPCMVSDEGACRIWWSAGTRENVWEGRKKAGTAAG